MTSFEGITRYEKKHPKTFYTFLFLIISTVYIVVNFILKKYVNDYFMCSHDVASGTYSELYLIVTVSFLIASFSIFNRYTSVVICNKFEDIEKSNSTRMGDFIVQGDDTIIILDNSTGYEIARVIRKIN